MSVRVRSGVLAGALLAALVSAAAAQQPPVERDPAPLETTDRPAEPTEAERRKAERKAKRDAQKERDRRHGAALLANLAGLVAIGTLVLGVRVLRERRPVVVPHHWVVPIVGGLVLFEFGDRIPLLPGDLDDWGSGGSLLLRLGMLGGVVWIVIAKMRSLRTRLVVGAISKHDAKELARAALEALGARSAAGGDAPAVEVEVDEKAHTLSLGKEGPKLMVKEIAALGVVHFTASGEAATQQRVELLDALVGCLEEGLVEARPRAALRCFVVAGFAVGAALLFAVGGSS